MLPCFQSVTASSALFYKYSMKDLSFLLLEWIGKITRGGPGLLTLTTTTLTGTSKYGPFCQQKTNSGHAKIS